MSPTAVSQKKNIAKKNILLPVLPIIFFFLHNINQFMELILTSEALLLFLIYSLLAIFIFVCGRVFFRLTIIQSQVISTLTITSFLFFGILQDYLFDFKKFPFLSNTFLLLLLFIIIILVISVFLKKRKKNPHAANYYLIILFIVLIFYETVMLGIRIISGKSMYAITHRMTSPVLTDEKMNAAERPDIYHIIFDEYTNPPALKKYWGFENDIYPFLVSKGFYTLDSAFSNYTTTPFSISSIVNLQYLRGADPYLERNSANFFVGHLVFRNNELFQFLKKTHYDFSIFSQLDDNKLLTTFGFGVDNPVNWLRKQTMERIFLNPWLMGKLRRFFGKKEEEPPMILKSKQHFAAYNKKALDHIFFDCQRLLNQHKATPLYSFTHFMLPHEPYILDENGNFVSLAEQADDMKGYLRQVEYSNKLIKQITMCLLSDTTRKKIIIFQGDHGYRSYTNVHVSFSTPYGALSAIYFYNKNYTGLRKNLSHVNTYRVIINNFFNGRLPLLKDSLVGRRN
jgi:hypothetical protein